MLLKTTLFITLLLALALSRIYSQVVTPSILNVGGGSAVVSGNTIEWSLGELMAIETAVTPGLTVTQGLLQPLANTSILPVTLIRFQGIKKPQYNQLDWATGYESGSTQMELQRSEDALRFTTIYQTAARGTANGSTYTYNDQQPFYGKVYYRLRLTEASGTVRYSAIVVLYDYEKSYWTVYPNPVPSGSPIQVSIQNADAATKATISLVDAAGRTVLQSNQQLVTGFQNISLPLRLPPGLYQVVVTGFGKNSSQKIIIK